MAITLATAKIGIFYQEKIILDIKKAYSYFVYLFCDEYV